MKKEVIVSPEAPAPIGPYSQAIAVGDWLFVSGQIGMSAATGEMVKGSITQETEAVMQNLRAVLAAAGSHFGQVVKCTIFIRDMNDFRAINEIYGRYFDQTPPARETVEVSKLPKGANVEISCIAMR